MNRGRPLIAWVSLAFVPSPALAAVPAIQNVAISNPHAPANTMMFEVRVRVRAAANDADHDARVGFAPSGTSCATGAWKMGREQRFATTNVLTWTLYNFQPGVAYDYKVQVGSGSTARTQCGALGTPQLPVNLAALNLQFAKRAPDTPYVLFDTFDCGSGTGATASRSHLLAVDTDSESIVWYLDVQSRSALGGRRNKGWRYQDGFFLTIMDKRWLYQWAWDGTVMAARDLAPDGECDDSDAYGPCLNHDAYQSETGDTYVITTRQSSSDLSGSPWEDCEGSLFIDDGFAVLDEDLDVIDQRFLMTDYGYDPAVDGGPHAGTRLQVGCRNNTWPPFFDPYESIDWTHVNSIAGSSFGGSEVFDLSLKEFEQVLRIDDAGAVVWTLGSDAAYSDWGPIVRGAGVSGPLGFNGQHDAHAVSANEILMFDNQGDRAGGRAIRLSLDEGPPAQVTLDASWAVVDAGGTRLECMQQGSAQEVPGSAHVLALCSPAYTIVELDDPTGAEGVPALAIWLDDTTAGATRFCTSGGPTSLETLGGFYRAYPVDAIGEF
jgi:hypothetical protein